MDKNYAAKELRDIVKILSSSADSFDGNVAWQTRFINQHLSGLQYAEAKLRALVSAIKMEFRTKAG